MLHRFKIQNLYGLYSYDLCFSSTQEHITFITGPNGYGKTTILKIIDAIYSLQFADLLTIRFEFIEMQIEKAKTEEERNSKLYKTLGTIIGLAFVIILI